MKFKIIKSPSKAVLNILTKRAGTKINEELFSADAVGLVQGQMIDMIYVADIAEKAVGVTVTDIRGNCPQHLMLIAIIGDTASVEAAISEIKSSLEKEKKSC